MRRWRICSSSIRAGRSLHFRFPLKSADGDHPTKANRVGESFRNRIAINGGTWKVSARPTNVESECESRTQESETLFLPAQIMTNQLWLSSLSLANVKSEEKPACSALKTKILGPYHISRVFSTQADAKETAAVEAHSQNQEIGIWFKLYSNLKSRLWKGEEEYADTDADVLKKFYKCTTEALQLVNIAIYFSTLLLKFPMVPFLFSAEWHFAKPKEITRI